MSFFEMTEDEQKTVLNQLHIEELKSVREIADDFNTYPNKIRRLGKKIGFEFRDKSEAQSVVLKTGKASHPTKGQVRPAHVKKAISSKIYDYWKNLDEDELEARAEKARENWDKLSDEQKEFMLNKATQARLETAKHGSRLEKALLEQLVSKGYKVDFHKEQSLLNERLQIDLYLPELRTCIEVDGKSHFEVLWTEKELQKSKERDFMKDGLILNAGHCIIRIRQRKDVSMGLVDNLSEQLFEILKDIKKSFPPVGSRKFVIEEK